MTRLRRNPDYVSDDDDDYDVVGASTIRLRDNDRAAVSDMSSSSRDTLSGGHTALSAQQQPQQGDLTGSATLSEASEISLQHLPPMTMSAVDEEWGRRSHGSTVKGAPGSVHMADPGQSNSLEDSYMSALAYQDGPTLPASSKLQQQPAQSDLHRGPSFMDSVPGVKSAKSVYQKYWEKDALVAVMGMTGSGKTTFISKVTGRNDLKIGHDLTSCTRDIQVVETKINSRVVRFVDTPGFSDTHLSDTEVLQMIADYLATAYKQGVKLSGIIYLHPISDTRVTHHSTKNLEMFRYLTGEKNLKNVVLATSMWDKVTEEEGARREQELKDKFWKLMLHAFKAKTMRYLGTLESAREVATLMLKNEPFYLQLQEEMGKDNMALKDTKAGGKVMEQILQMKEEHQRELAEMDRVIKSSAEESKTVIEALREEYQRQVDALQKTLRDERQMNEQDIRRLTERIHALESRGGCAVM
ncbi:P-loop containing nucleoside triphosphate hydrolase protein [Microdochium bolleyi]|uniref:p-loop containing nucleoside triphosphate hydrolase protein n=1 Tax=Microdochium bolleyi TaxID=196109 RepID=A0A136JH87_9PEZI|nr:P-loop containing nucleoside triphosphate hydrolase protein [Microdochium bolleyi]